MYLPDKFDATPETIPVDDPFSLKSLIAWLEKQPADRAYEFYDCDACLIAEYLRAVKGWETPANHTSSYVTGFFGSMEEYHGVAARWPWTFGAALERARALESAAYRGDSDE